ncbi:MAG TPA: energy-coupling factor ABC transporter permease [Anaeromyxobacteraceae bacterium]|nr:energy-coupling factor ABC transporter permease [Anaeromyxobacteraceae bacterium]
MHLSDAYLSPAAGIAFWSAAAVLVTRGTARLARSERLGRTLPLVAAAAAMTFALRMVRFPLLGTAACGHLTGGLLVAIVLGPDAAFLVLFAVQLVQALAFADGGILAVGANAVNAALWPAWFGRPLFQRLAPEGSGMGRVVAVAVAAALLSHEMGALGLAVAVGAGQPGLATGRFLALIAGAHVPLGVVEGLATAGLLVAGRRLLGDGTAGAIERAGGTAFLVVLGFSLFGAAVLSDFASRRPEWPAWSLAEAQAASAAPPAPLAAAAIDLQRRIAILPQYGESQSAKDLFGQAATSVAGLFGALAAAALALVPGSILAGARRLLRARSAAPVPPAAVNPYAPE